MRLIDADELMKKYTKYVYETKDPVERETAHNEVVLYASLLNGQPTAYDVDKVVERLEQMRDTITHNIALNSQSNDVNSEILSEENHYQRIIQIVKSGGIG